MRKERIKRRIVSMFLVVCMAVGTISVAPKEAKAVDVLSMFDVAGTMVRAGKSAMEQAKKENWSFKDAIGGTFKCIGKELLGINENESPGSTVIMNDVDLSGVESQLYKIQQRLDDQNMTLTALNATMVSNISKTGDALKDIKETLDNNTEILKYNTYLVNFCDMYDAFRIDIKTCETYLDSLKAESDIEVVKNTYDKLFNLGAADETNGLIYRIQRMGGYLRGDLSGVSCPGSVTDILCRYYKAAGYSDAETAAAVKDFVAQAYYTYNLANYYYMSITLFQSTYMSQNNLTRYDTDFGSKLGMNQIEAIFASMTEESMQTTTHVFYDLNKHFSSIEGLEVSYKGPAGYLMRNMKDSTMNVEPGAVITLPDSNSLLAAYFGSGYVKMFGGVCEYSYESSDSGVTINGDRIVFDTDFEEGTDAKVDIYCSIGDQKILLHTYTFTSKIGSLAGGYGTVEYPVVIKTEEQFAKFAGGSWNDSYVSLAADLDFEDKYIDTVSSGFSGIFYGNGHTLSNIKLQDSSQNPLGIFSSISGGTVQDLIVNKAVIQPSSSNSIGYVGIIAGKVQNGGKILRCDIVDSSVASVQTGGAEYVGGVAGWISSSTIEGCMVRNTWVAVGESPNAGNSVMGIVGGIVGYATDGSKINYCGKEDGYIWSFCTDKESYTGGLVGQGHYSDMNDCWNFVTNEGRVDRFNHSGDNHGTIAGYCNDLEIKNTYVYNGENANKFNVNMIFVGTLRQGVQPEISYVEDFTLSKLGYEYVGMLTNADITGHPIRLNPVKVDIKTDNAKTTFYYGQDLTLNGVSVRLIRSSGFNSRLIPYDVTTDYSSTQPGRYVVTISSGNVKADYDVLVANKPHTYVATKKAATCTEDGYVGYKCQDEGCDSHIADDVLKATGHSTTKEKAKEKTCKTPGNIEYWFCSNCKKCFLDESGEQEISIDDTIIPAAHTIKAVKAVSATCAKAGNKAYWYCEVCHKYFTDAKCTSETTLDKLKIPATGKHTGKTTVTKATMKSSGKIVVRCSVCGKLISTKAIPKIASITLSSTDHTYNGNVRKPVVTIKDSTGKKLGSTAYTLTYSAGRKYVGRYTVTIRFKGNYSGSATKTFTIKPKTTSISGVAAAKNQLTIKWAKQPTQTTGYQLQYSTSSTFAGAKTVTIAKPATTSYTASKLLAKKKYYVRIRTYKKVTQNGTTKTYYSNWSSTKSATTK